MQYVRKIFYLDLYDGDNKVKNCGYVKMETMSSKTYFYFYLNDIAGHVPEELEASVTLSNEKIQFEHLKVKNGSVCEVVMLSRKISEQQIEHIRIRLAGQKEIKYVREKMPEKSEQILFNQQAEVRENRELPVEATSRSESNEVQHDSLVMESKWEHLKQMFSMVSIFGENTETLLLKPGDLVVLPEEYHYLTTNSFLMHGYYNYHQLLLTRWQSEDGEQYYVGVPGTFYDREKSVARMFGFEGFENGESSRREIYATSRNSTGEDRVYPGCFGYYMKKVSI